MKNTNFGEKYYLHSIIMAIALFFFYLLGINKSFLYSSILDYKNISSDIFDGTVYPIEFIPDPIALNYDERRKKYVDIDSKYFIKIPTYTPEIFGKIIEKLITGSKEYIETLSQRIVFTVPYLGNYNFDYKEFAGSHPGVDIVAPEGTPIKNIAEGVVVNVGYQPSGFGNYVVIRHNGITLPQGGKGDIYSVYGHMNQSIVEGGTKIKKGTTIGYVGKTGVATVPHLHFQIDLASAPYNPYWPFTSNDMKIAKVGFIDGVNIGLGKENALLYTLNPLKFVNEYISSQHNIVEEESSKEIQGEEVKQEIIQENKSEVILTQNDEKAKDTPITHIEKPQKIEENIKPISDTTVYNSTGISGENNFFSLKKEEITQKDVELLSSLHADLALSNTLDLTLPIEEKIISSDIKDENSETLQNIQDTQISTGTNEIIAISHIEEPIIQKTIEEIQIPNKIHFRDINKNYPYRAELDYFMQKDIVSGFSDGTFRPKNNITRVEALKIILLANNMKSLPDQKSQFIDIRTNSWENGYINSAINSKIISVKNKNFRPFKNISRVECLKLSLYLAGINISGGQNNTLIINDVHTSDWYYKYVNYAIENHLFELKNNKFYPNKPVNREELISILYKVIKK